jgi:hypothetical protein
VADPNGEYRSCAVCGRHLLRGEHATDYADTDGEIVPVCPLCKPRAEASGWVPADLATVAVAPEPPRRRPALNLRERLTRRAEPAASEPAAPQAPPPPPSALEVFNSSSEVRKVAGLRRSLGEPRVSVRDGEGGARLVTVAWDLSWYQWSVRGEDIKQVGKGNEISELPITDRQWNASAGEDGRLTLA